MRTALCRISQFFFLFISSLLTSNDAGIMMPNQLIIIIKIIMNTTLTGKEETPRVVVLFEPVAERWCKHKRKSIKRLKILLAVIFVWIPFLNTPSIQLEKEKEKCDACEYPQLLRLWCLNASTSHVCALYNVYNNVSWTHCGFGSMK